VAAVVPTLERALGLIRAGREHEVRPHLVALGQQLLPLLKLLERDLKLSVLMADCEKNRPDPAQEEKDAGQE
jgi:hypothetical protein